MTELALALEEVVGISSILTGYLEVDVNKFIKSNYRYSISGLSNKGEAGKKLRDFKSTGGGI